MCVVCWSIERERERDSVLCVCVCVSVCPSVCSHASQGVAPRSSLVAVLNLIPNVGTSGLLTQDERKSQGWRPS